MIFLPSSASADERYNNEGKSFHEKPLILLNLFRDELLTDY